MLSVRAKDGRVTVSLAAGPERLERDRRRIFREIGQSLLVSVRAGIEAEESPDGEAWEPLRPSTVRQRGGDAHPVLQRSGRLKRSITMRLIPEGVIVGTNLVYAPVHQFGAEISKRAGAVKLHFRRIRRGTKKGQVRFAKANDKRASFGMAAAAHTARIPARPFLFRKDGDIPESWKAAVTAIIKRHLSAPAA